MNMIWTKVCGLVFLVHLVVLRQFETQGSGNELPPAIHTVSLILGVVAT